MGKPHFRICYTRGVGHRRHFVLLNDHGSYVFATRRWVWCRKTCSFLVLVRAHDFESMVSWPWPAKLFFLFLGHGCLGPSLQVVHQSGCVLDLQTIILRRRRLRLGICLFGFEVFSTLKPFLSLLISHKFFGGVCA